MGLVLIKPHTHIDFVGSRRIAYLLSIIIILIGLASLIIKGGPTYGIDFAGGTVVQLQFQKPIQDELLKQTLEKSGLDGLSIQQFGDGGRDYLLRFSASNSDANEVRRAVNASLTDFSDNAPTIQRLEMVGPKVGDDLKNKALEAMFYSILLIAVYISGRFEQRWMTGAVMAATLWGLMYLMSFTPVGMLGLVVAALIVTLGVSWKLKLNFALGAVISLLHDVLITVGILSLLNIEFDLNILAALLTLVGYSLNDTIIVYDRIRENLRATPEKSMSTIINESINQTLSRTILTGGTTLLATFSLYTLGGEVIHDFAFTMFIGIIIGTFSSIYVASPILQAFGSTDQYVHEEVEIEKPGAHGMV